VKLIWFDCETTGLDPEKNAILEVAVAVADLAAPFELGKVTQFVLRFDDAHHHGPQCGTQQKPTDAVIRKWAVGTLDTDGPCPACAFSPEARAMHERTGLLSECKASKTTMGEVEDYLLTLAHGEPDHGDDKPTLAGSTCHFDRGFLRAHAPRFSAKLSHHHYDVSAVKLFCESFGMPRIAKANAHSAVEDVEESVRHAVMCAEWLRKMGALIGPLGSPLTLGRAADRADTGIVHLSYEDRPLCEFSGELPEWPAGFYVVSSLVTCDRCKEAYPVGVKP
jgi:oligoribonuclease